MSEVVGKCSLEEEGTGICTSLRGLTRFYSKITDVHCGIPNGDNRTCPIAQLEDDLSMSPEAALHLYQVTIVCILAQPSAELNQVS